MEEQPNLEYIKELASGDLAFEKEICQVVKEELPIEIEDFQNLIKNKKFVEASDSVHKIKHKIGVLGLKRGYELANLFEMDLKNEKLKHMKAFEMLLDKMLKFVESF